VEPPHVAVRHRLDTVRPDVRAAVALGQKLRASLGPVVVGLQQRRKEALAQLVGGMRS
jgi:hypothetical protein